MKYFTVEWWMGDVEDDDNQLMRQYQVKLKTIEHRLPDDLLKLYKSISLHDSKLSDIEVKPSDKTVTIVTNSWTSSGQAVKYTLRYGGVVAYNSHANYKKGLAGPHGYGDWGYDEIDIDDLGIFSHCVLFSTGITIEIYFTEFTISQSVNTGDG